MPVILSVQRWYESERGWGQRFDGFTVAVDPKYHQQVLQKMRKHEASLYGVLTPEYYTAPDGPSYAVQVTRLPYREIKALNDKGYFWSMDKERFGGIKALR